MSSSLLQRVLRHSVAAHRPLHASSPALIQLDGVAKAYFRTDGSSLHAVHPLTLSIGRGDIFGLVGKSGAGKSTLLRIINLLERPDSGAVWVAGQELGSLSRSALRNARRRIGMIFQQFNLLQNANVFDNVAFPLRIHGSSNARAIAARVRECLDLVGIADKIDSYPAQLSGGQKQRVAIARALAGDPQVLLCDEPTSALDAETTEALLKTLRDINASTGVTIVIVTHELSVVTQLCRNVAVIEDGRIADQFAVDQHDFVAATRLGQELVRQVNTRHSSRETRIAASVQAATGVAYA